MSRTPGRGLGPPLAAAIYLTPRWVVLRAASHRPIPEIFMHLFQCVRLHVQHSLLAAKCKPVGTVLSLASKRFKTAREPLRGQSFQPDLWWQDCPPSNGTSGFWVSTTIERRARWVKDVRTRPVVDEGAA